MGVPVYSGETNSPKGAGERALSSHSTRYICKKLSGSETSTAQSRGKDPVQVGAVKEAAPPRMRLRASICVGAVGSANTAELTVASNVKR